jgi:hypothetical protein
VKVARGVADWMNSKHEEQWQSICGQRQAMGFLKKQSVKIAGKLLSMKIHQPRIMTGRLAGYCHLKGHLFKQELVNSPECDRCKQALETASHVLCDSVATLTL